MKIFLPICIATLSIVEGSVCFSQQNISCKHLKQMDNVKWLMANGNTSTINHQPLTIEHPSLLADSLRSDTINILKYTINLQITDFSAPDTIWGNTQVQFTPLVNNISTLSLDLLRMTIDSISQNNTLLTYSYNDTLLIVNLPSVHNIGDTSVATVYYHGDPVMDASGWGGWYNQSGYAFNLGVGFAADPHNYGRVWFPCFDNFVERSKYEFNIKTNGGKIAYCNGALTKDTTDVNGFRTRTWKLNEEIPTYLACVNVAAYTHVNQTFNGINGAVPVMLTALPADTANMKNSFVNLAGAFAAHENRYGSFLWNKVGYSLVPFSSGAMEHATNIAYPRIAALGNLTYQDIMAHEFSHHWWGDLATCDKQEDMWINEGMAVFSEYIFEEWVNGITAYKNQVRANHDDMVHYVHIREGGYRAISGIPGSLTYGDHVYLKGSDVAHTMRGYLGDSLFFLGLKYVLANHQFTDINSAKFRDFMTTATGVNMTDFFSGWVFNGGWPHFSVDSFTSFPNGGNYDVTIYIKQKLDGAPSFFNNVPLEITFKDASWNEVAKTINVSGQNTTATVTIPFNPAFVGVDLNEKISDAITSDTKKIKTTGTSFGTTANGRMQISVLAITPGDSAFVLVEHNWAAPDSFKTPNPDYKLSPYHYWKVSGLFPALFDATGTITYDGRTTGTSGGNYYLDHQLITATNQEDSIVLMYRKDAADEWNWFPYYTKTMGNLTDKTGTIKIDSLLPGEYTIAFAYLLNNAVAENENETSVLVYPNPFSTSATLEINFPLIKGAKGDAVFVMYDVYGREMMRLPITCYRLPITRGNLASGFYFYKLQSNDEMIGSGKIIIE